MSLLILDDLKAFLNITDSDNDSELTGKLDAAEAWVARYLGASDIGGGTVTVTATASGRNLVLPVTGVTGVTSVTDPYGNAVTVQPYDVNLSAGIIRVPWRSHHHHNGSWTVVLVMPDGWAPDVREAVLIMAGHLWETQRGVSPTALQGGDQYGPPAVGYAVPNRAVELLAGLGSPGIA